MHPRHPPGHIGALLRRGSTLRQGRGSQGARPQLTACRTLLRNTGSNAVSSSFAQDPGSRPTWKLGIGEGPEGVVGRSTQQLVARWHPSTRDGAAGERRHSLRDLPSCRTTNLTKAEGGGSWPRLIAGAAPSSLPFIFLPPTLPFGPSVCSADVGPSRCNYPGQAVSLKCLMIVCYRSPGQPSCDPCPGS